jgi:hypothetical protein
LLSGGIPRSESAAYEHLNQIFEKLPAAFPALKFDLMIGPRGLHPNASSRADYLAFVQLLKEWGVDALSVNLELYGDAARSAYIPEKHQVGRESYLEFLDLAVSIFGIGKVRSVLLVGLEDGSDTLIGVEELCRRKVLVELSPFTAFPGILLQRPEPDPDLLETIYEQSMEIAARHEAPFEPFCVPCSHNIL